MLDIAAVFNILSKIDTVAGIIGAIFSLLIWLRLRTKEKFNEQRISICLKFENMAVTLPYAIERKYLTRSELQGLLGILPLKQKTGRYSIAFLNSKEFFDRLKAAQDEAAVQTVEIQCSAEELKQFDLEQMRQQCRIEE